MPQVNCRCRICARTSKSEEDLVTPFDLLDVTLGTAIDELTRPIDAIRHQAKTVTVGTSRKEKELKGIIFDLLETLKFSVKNLTYREHPDDQPHPAGHCGDAGIYRL